MNLVFANDIYRILQIELHRAGVDDPGPKGRGLTDLSKPSIDWVPLSESMGVPARSVRTAEELSQALGESLAEAGPRLIEVRMS